MTTNAPISPPAACEATGPKRWLVEQFRRPHGALGILAGWIMARRASNRERNTWTVDLLDVQPDDRVLEVGFGPGLAIALAAARATRGLVAGLDHSEVMLRQATRRNRRAIDAGRVDLRLGSAERPPDFGPPFDKIFAVNALHFGQATGARLRAWLRYLRPGGVLALTFQPPDLRATDEDALGAGRWLVAALEDAGYVHVRLRHHRTPRVLTVCAIGKRPSSD
jgi:SAM-dependent methyltransferase